MCRSSGTSADAAEQPWCYGRAGCVACVDANDVSELQVSDYGEGYWSDRGYECSDLEGHHWWFYQRLRNPKNA
jgi:hypothetical protein